eukprot:775144-Pelagomonas_calceolata.AAC.2
MPGSTDAVQGMQYGAQVQNDSRPSSDHKLDDMVTFLRDRVAGMVHDAMQHLIIRQHENM